MPVSVYVSGVTLGIWHCPDRNPSVPTEAVQPAPAPVTATDPLAPLGATDTETSIVEPCAVAEIVVVVVVTVA